MKKNLLPKKTHNYDSFYKKLTCKSYYVKTPKVELFFVDFRHILVHCVWNNWVHLSENKN